MQIGVRDYFEAWQNNQLPTSVLLAKCKADGHLRLHDAIMTHEAGKLSLLKLNQIYCESIQVHGLLNAAKSSRNAGLMLVSTLWPKNQSQWKPIDDVNAFVQQARQYYEDLGFEVMKRWMQNQLSRE
ncbi:MAG: hypothetical protein BWY54_01038 [Candidatus Dependentiae bacterium ADurb.Bin331]|nr:MAG: hypothetical protein BWY54_01038 [Candidatus Dependentiae bacterium ADurb.Bin331]